MRPAEDRGEVPVRSLMFADRVLAEPLFGSVAAPNLQRCSLSQLRGTETLVLHDVPTEENRIRFTRAQFYDDPKKLLDRTEAAFNAYERSWVSSKEISLSEVPLVTQTAARELEGLNGLVWPSVAELLKSFAAQRRVCMRIESNLALYLPPDSERTQPSLFVITVNEAAMQEYGSAYSAQAASGEAGFESEVLFPPDGPRGDRPPGFLITLNRDTLMPEKAECRKNSEDIFGLGRLMTHLCAGANRKLEDAG